MSSILINGHPTEQLSVLDRGFQYGDGLFETLSISNGQPQQWSRHMARLEMGCNRLGIAMPDLESLRTEAESLCRTFVAESRENAGVLKITVTRGSGGRGYATAGVHEPTRVVAVFKAADFPASHVTEGVKLRLCEMRLGHNPVLAGIKHLNRLEQVLARSEWDDPDIAEGVLLDNTNNVIEGTMSNLFCVKASEGAQSTLVTPVLSRCGVQGVTRDRILEIAAQLGIPTQETDLQVADFQQASEVFISNSLIGIWPVRRFMQQDYTVGPITRRLRATLEQAIGVDV